MKFVGLDLGGLNSLACIRDDAGEETFQGSAYPERPSCVVFPLVRKERLIAGDEALKSERGLGALWPPLAMTASDGWSRLIPPVQNGRVLLGTVWQRLNAGEGWPDPKWQPPDELPPVSKPTPAECVIAEACSVLNRAHSDAQTVQCVLAIPNQLPEESQESLLGRLPAGTRLVWRSVAAAMSWVEAKAGCMQAGTCLAVVDVGFHGVEVSVFEFRRQGKDGLVFHMPVRRIDRLHFTKTDTLLADKPSPFLRLHPDLKLLEAHLGAIFNAVGGQSELLFCGPLAQPFVALLQRRFPDRSWPAPDPNAVARGSSLFVWRLTRDWPTYLDILPSLELFTLTEEREPKWLPLIPPDCEVSGGLDFQQPLERRIFIEKGTIRLASWLQRSGEIAFRKLSTDLPVQAAQNAWVDLNVSARSAGGFARVRITPSSRQFEVFGTGQGVMLNWQSMERVTRDPGEKWPKGMVAFGWPECGKLYAHRPIFDEFIASAERELAKGLEHRAQPQRMEALDTLKKRVAKTIAPHLAGVANAGGDAAPVNLLVCFSTETPCKFMGGGYTEGTRITELPQSKHEIARKISRLFWERLQVLNESPRAAAGERERNALIYLLGRLGGYAPEPFQNQLVGEIYPVTGPVHLFAAGRVLQTPEHGHRLFGIIKEKADFGQTLNNNWLRMLVYVLYQRPDVLREVPRDHVVAAVSLCLDAFEQQVQQGEIKVVFMNSLRALALLLRARRHAQARDFLSPDICPHDEALLAKRFIRVLRQANSLRLRLGPRTLVERVTEWLDFIASTDEMPPIAPPGEDDDSDGQNDN
jgi:hypothetical protein